MNKRDIKNKDDFEGDNNYGDHQPKRIKFYLNTEGKCGCDLFERGVIQRRSHNENSFRNRIGIVPGEETSTIPDDG